MKFILKNLKCHNIIVTCALALTIFNASNVNSSSIAFETIPYIKNYSNEAYQADPQNWTVVQDKRGIMYFGNNDGVLEFDGTIWNLIEIPNKQPVRSLAVDNKGKVYVGTNGDIGYLTASEEGKIHYISLIDKIPEQQRDFGDIWEIYSMEQGILFQTNSKLILLKDGATKIIEGDYDFRSSNYINKRFYVVDTKKGLLTLNSNGLTQIPGSEEFFDKDIKALIPLEKEKIWAVKNNKGFFEFDSVTEDNKSYSLKDHLIQIKTEADKYLEENNIIYGRSLDSNIFALSTLSDGILILDNHGNVVQKFDKERGLQNQDANNIYFDLNGNLWIALEDGISFVETGSPFTFINDKNGLTGAINSFKIIKNNIFALTSHGIYQIPLKTGKYSSDNPTRFKLIQETEGDAWQIEEINEGAVYAHQYGLFMMEKQTITKISDEWTHTVLKLKSKPNHFLVEDINGLKLYEYRDNIFKNKEAIEIFKDKPEGIIEDNNGNIWISHKSKGVFRLNLSGFKNQPHKLKLYTIKDGLPSDIGNKAFLLSDRPVFGTYKGLFVFNSDKYRFEPDPILNQFFSEKQVNFIKQDQEKNIWFSAGTRFFQHGMLKYEQSGQYKLITAPFTKIGNFIIHDMIAIDEENVLFGTSKGIIHYNPKKKTVDGGVFSSLIRGIVDTVFNKNLFSGTFTDSNGNVVLNQMKHHYLSLPYTENSLRFTFSAPFYEGTDHIQYKYKLENFDKEWSEWVKDNKKEYTNIPEGKYSFRAKSRNVYQTESQDTNFNFSILPPWYRTIWAYASYFILFISIIFAIVKLATLRLQRINKAYGRYLPGSFLNLFNKNVISFKLGDMMEKEATIMFSDIRSYTALSESMQPEDNFKFLVGYLSRIGMVLNNHKGFAVQYYGDGILAMFAEIPDYAVSAAIAMQCLVRQYSVERSQKGRKEIKVGVGLHTGKVIIGIRGDTTRWEGGIVGDSVNLSARLESLTKQYGASTIISEHTYSRLENPGQFNTRYLGRVRVKGKDDTVGLYEVLDGLAEKEFELKMKTKSDFDQGISLYYNKKFVESLSMLSKVIKIDQTDMAAFHYIELNQNVLNQGVDEDWDGVEKIINK